MPGKGSGLKIKVPGNVFPPLTTRNRRTRCSGPFPVHEMMIFPHRGAGGKKGGMAMGYT